VAKETSTAFINYTRSLWGLAFLFVFLYLMLGFFNRLATDDFYFLHAQQTIGAQACVKECYETFSGRWCAYWLTAWLLQFSDTVYFLFCFHLIILIGFVTLFYKIIQRFSFQLKWDLSPANSLLYAIVFCCSFFLSCFGIGESWFWYTSVCSYLLSILAFLFLIDQIFIPGYTIIGSLSLFILPAFIGGASESYAISACMVLLLILLSPRLKWLGFISSYSRSKLLLSFIILIISFSITALSPGNTVRISLLPHPDIAVQLFQPLKSLIKVGLLFFLTKLPIVVLFSFPWYFLGNAQSGVSTLTRIEFIKRLKFYLLATVIAVFVLILPAVLLLHETPPNRALSQVSLLLCVVVSYLFYLSGSYFRVVESTMKWLRIGAFFLSFFLMGFLLLQQYFTAGVYAKAYDERVALIKNHRKVNAPLFLKPLPSCGLLYSAEISFDSSFYSNRHLQKAFGIKYGINRIK